MNAVAHMSAHDPQPATALLGKLCESFHRRLDPIGIDRVDRKRAVLLLDDPVQSRSRCLGKMKKNQRRATHFAMHLEGAVAKISRSRPFSCIA